jgi:hypothetical protein
METTQTRSADCRRRRPNLWYNRPGVDHLRLFSAWLWACENGFAYVIVISLVSLLGQRLIVLSTSPQPS